MKPDRFHSPHARKATLFVMLVVAWLLWSGLFKSLLLAPGLFSCALTFLLARRMGYFDNDFFALRFSMKLLSYWAWLAREIYRSSLQVARVVLDPSLPISPRTIEIKSTSSHLVTRLSWPFQLRSLPARWRSICTRARSGPMTPDLFLPISCCCANGFTSVATTSDRRSVGKG